MGQDTRPVLRRVVYTLLIACLILYAAMLIPLFSLTLYRPFKSAEPLDDFPVLRAREKLKCIISMLGVMHWMVLLMCYLSLVLPLAPQLMQKASHRYLDILLVALVAAAFFVPLYFWLRSKLPAGTEEGAEEEKRAQEYLKHWKLGIFYWDPTNPSAVVPRQFGMGYTLNFAARLAWVLLGLILLPTIFLLTILIIFNFVGKMR
jgi:uncharacterized membrane protein